MKPIEFFDGPLALRMATATTMLEHYSRSGLYQDGDDIFSPTVLDRPYDVINGVALINVRGVLVHERSWWWDEMSYSRIAENVAMAIDDGEVKGLALCINSPGGVVSGCFDFSDALYSMRGTKPIWSLVNEAAYSAAYAIASAADRILVPRTGGVGSVGVITLHVDITKMLEQMGVKVTTIQFGSKKSDSYPTTPLSDEARKDMQSDVDTLGEMFVELVARNRGIDASTVRDTQAGCFFGEAGVSVGFADAVMPYSEALAEFITFVNKEN